MLRRSFATLLLSLLLFAVMAQSATDYSKMSPWVRLIAAQNAPPTYPEGASIPYRSIVSPSGDEGGTPSLLAFIQTNDDDVLERHGCRTYARKDDIVIASIPLSQLAELSQHASIKRIEASESCHTTMDTVPKIINTLPVYTATQSHQAFTGSGVVVGIMDIGFDLTHPNFYSDAALSNYRIKAFWDQLSPDTIGSTFPVGRDYIGSEAILAKGCATDGSQQSHGTHTTGIAAGSGYDSPYRGVAFESDICLVANAVTADTVFIDPKDYYKYTSATDALGFKYIFDYADSQGKPCVASFSEGYSPYLDEEDSLYSAFLDKLAGPGHIIAVSAGNENQSITYAEKPVGTQQAGAFIHIYKKQANYHLKSNGPMNLTLHFYDSSHNPSYQHTIASSDNRLDTLLADTLILGSDSCFVSATRYPSRFTADTLYTLQIMAHRNLHELGYIAIVMEGADSRVQLYGSSSNPLRQSSVDPQWNAATYGHNILAPGCFPSAICVGATTWRTSYTTHKGTTIISGNQTYGKRMTESSTGPALNDLMKPDVVAPGYDVISSYSSYYLETIGPDAWDYRNSVKLFEHNGRTYSWTALSGTSMACPAAAGTIALWLQAKPTLTREEIIDVFSRTCQHPDESLSYPNNDYGYGEIDAYRGLLDILGLTGIESISQHQPAGVSIIADNCSIHLTFIRQPASPINVSIYSTNGAMLWQTTIMPAGSYANISLPQLASGIYAIQLTGSDKELSGSHLIRLR